MHLITHTNWHVQLAELYQAIQALQACKPDQILQDVPEWLLHLGFTCQLQHKMQLLGFACALICSLASQLADMAPCTAATCPPKAVHAIMQSVMPCSTGGSTLSPTPYGLVPT